MDECKQMLAVEAIDNRSYQRLRLAPLFVMPQCRADMTDEEYEWAEQNVLTNGNVPVGLPFPDFRVAFWDEPDTWIGVRQCGTSLWTVLAYTNRGTRGWVRTNIYASSTPQGGIKGWMFGNGRFIPPENYSSADPKIQHMFNEARQTTIRLIVALRASGCMALKVAEPPRSPPRSVEWHLAREHYLLVHPSQARQCRDGSRAPTGHELQRAAHWRRAHFRRLTSPRYKESTRSRLVPVRESWVGPEKWRGRDGKIYAVATQFRAANEACASSEATAQRPNMEVTCNEGEPAPVRAGGARA